MEIQASGQRFKCAATFTNATKVRKKEDRSASGKKNMRKNKITDNYVSDKCLNMIKTKRII